MDISNCITEYYVVIYFVALSDYATITWKVSSAVKLFRATDNHPIATIFTEEWRMQTSV